MKRGFIVVLCLSILLIFAGCGQAASGSAAGEIEPQSDAEPESEDAAQASPAAASAAVASAAMAESDAIVISSEDCFDTAYCFRPAADGTYHFCALTADAFQGNEVDYDGDTITWTVYVLEEEFDDAWRFLGQAYSPSILDLNGSLDLPLKAGEYVYCVCSLNAFTGSPAADGSGTLTVTVTEADYAPNADNNYQLPVTVNSETRIDLDGDGLEETVYYGVLTDQLGFNNVWSGAKPVSLTVDGVEYLHSDRENPMDAFGFWMENPDTTYYYIVNLDDSDSYQEIAIADLGSNDYRTTHYFRYAEDALVYLGATSGLPDDPDTVFYGNGSLSAMDRLNVMQTWSGLRTFTLGADGILHQLEGEFCQPVLPEGWAVTLNQSLTVYQDPDLDAATVTLAPRQEALSFPSTDGEHWVEILCANGERGWAYFSDFSTLISDGVPLDAFDVFGNLFLAG